ncbi:MAG: helix-turn-helix domain-containing protein [Nitrospira sp.]|nr:MAG: helix-turn-helix domain-containing protein [Nitrospira sp.]
MEPVLLRVQETAKLLKVSKWTIYRWIEEGRLRATKIGRGSVRVFQASVNGLIEGAPVDHRETQSGSPSIVPPVRVTDHERKKVASRRKRVR